MFTYNEMKMIEDAVEHYGSRCLGNEWRDLLEKVRILSKEVASEINFNNIYITHNGVKVSIAQHRDADPLATKYQEVGIGEPSADMPIIRYGSTLTELIDALQRAQSKIDYGIGKVQYNEEY